MEKKESPKLTASTVEPKAGIFSRRLSALSGRVFSIVKFILGICLLPFVYSSTSSFLQEFSHLMSVMQGYFWAGIISFLVIYLFVWEPVIIYNKGHKLVEVCCSFFKPLVKVAPYLVPIYLVILFIAYIFLRLLTKESWLLTCSLFLFGFSIAMHLVFSAKTVRSKKEDFLKANYLFGASFIYLVNVFIMAGGLSMVFKEFSFASFGRSSFAMASSIFYTVFKQLFLR
ncbi:MAG: hypothetical protein NC923_06980 [Candidatus Omnitrophica bacterium]|nr:hypothetical protein [Candidatus Omnitrophota bacterium]